MSRRRKPRVFSGSGHPTLPMITGRGESRKHTQGSLTEALRRVIDYAERHSAPGGDVEAARVAAEAFAGAKIDVLELKPLAESRRSSNKSLRDNRWTPQRDPQVQRIIVQKARELLKLGYGRHNLVGQIGPVLRRKGHPRSDDVILRALQDEGILQKRGRKKE